MLFRVSSCGRRKAARLGVEGGMQEGEHIPRAMEEVRRDQEEDYESRRCGRRDEQKREPATIARQVSSLRDAGCINKNHAFTLRTCGDRTWRAVRGGRPVLIDGGCDDVCRYGWGKGVQLWTWLIVVAVVVGSGGASDTKVRSMRARRTWECDDLRSIVWLFLSGILFLPSL